MNHRNGERLTAWLCLVAGLALLGACSDVAERDSSRSWLLSSADEGGTEQAPDDGIAPDEGTVPEEGTAPDEGTVPEEEGGCPQGSYTVSNCTEEGCAEVCVPLPPEGCAEDADCFYEVDGSTGRCFDGGCVFDPLACDDTNPCATGMECRSRCWTNLSSDDQGEVEETICAELGHCIPVGGCEQGHDEDCAEGLRCLSFSFLPADEAAAMCTEFGDDSPTCLVQEYSQFGRCAAPAVSDCTEDSDCQSNGWQQLAQGFCVLGSAATGYCIYDPLYCDASHPCGQGAVCVDPCRLEPDGQWHNCDGTPQCVPEGMCAYDWQCAPGMICLSAFRGYDSYYGECADGTGP